MITVELDEKSKWKPEDEKTILNAVETIDEVLSGYQTSFEELCGRQHVRFNGDLYKNTKSWAYSTGNTVVFQPGFVIYRLFIHELGHTFDRAIIVKKYNLTPSLLLWSEGVKTEDGKLVTGHGTLAEPRRYGYSRWGGDLTQNNGYPSLEFPDQCHAKMKGTWIEGWNTPKEDWGDLWLNWICGNFLENPAGKALKRFVDNHMSEWINIAKGK